MVKKALLVIAVILILSFGLIGFFSDFIANTK